MRSSTTTKSTAANSTYSSDNIFHCDGLMEVKVDELEPGVLLEVKEFFQTLK